MFRKILLGGLAAAAFAPSLAQAQSDAQSNCREQRHDSRVVGTIVGAGLGALLGNAISDGRTGGTVVGGVGGAVAGNAIGGGSVNCGSNQYGYYDDSGRWVPNTSTSYGFYDANGRWVDTSTQGYAPPPPSDAYRQQGAYAPPPAPYDAGPGDAGPGDAGPRAMAYDGHDHWAGAPGDTRAREDWLEGKIQQRIADGALDERQGRRALRQIRDIRRMDASYRSDNGHLSEDQRRDILARLDDLRAGLWADRGQPGVQRSY